MEVERNIRKHWVDLLRGLCMIAILLDHTEIYYTGSNIIDYSFYVVNALVIFFFLSGYLFYKSNTDFSIIHKLRSIARSILLPYFVFTMVIALPKSFAHSYDISSTLLSILTGDASWFVAALAVAEAIFALMLWASKGRNILLAMSAALCFVGCYVLSTREILCYWHIENAFLAVPLLYLGYLYHRYEHHFYRFSRPFYTVFLLFLLVLLKVYEHSAGITFLIEPIRVGNWYVFWADVLVSILCLVQISKAMGEVYWLEWTGRRSLVYYFFSGGVPLCVSWGLGKMGMNYSSTYCNVVFAFLCVYLFASLIAGCVYRYFSFVLGKGKRE